MYLQKKTQIIEEMSFYLFFLLGVDAGFIAICIDDKV
jgi:hypothetical protein